MKRRTFLKGLLAFALSPTPVLAKKNHEVWHCAAGVNRGKLEFDSGIIYCPYIPLIKR